MRLAFLLEERFRRGEWLLREVEFQLEEEQEGLERNKRGG